MTQQAELPRLGLVGGTGALGRGLALRWALRGYPVLIGSRDEAKAQLAAAALSTQCGRTVTAGTNRQVAEQAELVIVTVPFAAQSATLGEIRRAVQGKIVLDTTVPLVPPKVMRVQLPAAGSAAGQARKLLGEKVRLVSAFQNIAATHLSDPQHALEGDVLVCGDDKDARAAVVALAEAVGLRAWHAGPLDNAVAAESLTPVLIFLNRHYGLEGAGIRICAASG